jgi:HSP20 family protein
MMAAMRHRVHAIALPSEVGVFADEIRQVFLELGRVFGPDSLAGECSPTIDVFETDEAMEVVVDLAGVDAGGVRVMTKGDAILVAGEKPPRRVRGEATFHLVERGYGRFARAIRITRPCDMARATAAFVRGELRITLPKIQERRGATLPITIVNG